MKTQDMKKLQSAANKNCSSKHAVPTARFLQDSHGSFPQQ